MSFQSINPMSQTVAFHLTHDCNLRCTYCYAGDKQTRHMTTSIADQAIDFVLNEARAAGTENLTVMFFGGEPLLRLDLLCMICQWFEDRSDGIDVSFSMSTNGVLLNKASIERLATHRVYVSMSIDGIPSVQDHQRPFPDGSGSSQAVARAVPLLLEWNPCADSRFVVTPYSAPHVSESVQWIAEQGFSYITLAMDFGADWTMDDFKVLKKELKRTATWYEKRLSDNRAVYLNCFDERISSRTKKPLECQERCAIGIGQYSIAPSGNLYPCVQFVGTDDNQDYIIGTIADGFNHNKRKEIFETSEREKPECEGCKLTGRCSSWCACSNFSTLGCIDRASPIVCEYERIVMPIADNIANTLWKKRSRPFIHRFYNPAFPVLNFAEQLIIKEASNG